MKTTIVTIICLIFLSSCSEQKKQNEKRSNNYETEKEQITVDKIKSDQKTKTEVGKELFKTILDTIKIEKISADFLINNKWIYRAFNDCESYLKFQVDGKGISYNCEMEEDYEMTYKIERNKVFVAEYNIPHVDNEERKKIKYRDDTYIYNGHSLIMVDSKMYNMGGVEWVPKIEVVINYER